MSEANGEETAREKKIFHIADEVQKYNSSNPFIAFEYYPPRTDNGVENLMKRLSKMKILNPLYVDFTWGAGGTTSDLTMDLCIKAQQDHKYVANMHLTCTNMPREKIDLALKVCKAKNIKNILALRGDPPVGQVDWKPVDSGFSCALDLIHYMKKFEQDNGMEEFFNITVAGYPEGHPNKIETIATLPDETSPVDLSQYNLTDSEKGRVVRIGKELMVCKDKSFDEEMKYLKEKVDAGAKMIVTQMFYDADVVIAFMKKCKDYGINVPVIPGIMCVTNYNGFKRMITLCKTRIPDEVREAFEAASSEPQKMKQAGIELGIKMCQKLLAAGAQGLHFYTLNLDEVAVGILKGLNLYGGEY